MPQAVMHILSSMILLDLWRDYFVKIPKKVPLLYIFIGGVAGLAPDMDIPVYWLFHNLLGIETSFFHRTFSHSIFSPLIFIIASFALFFYNKNWSLLLGIIAFGFTVHIGLDWLLDGYIMPFYPFSLVKTGLNLAGILGFASFVEGLDAIILIFWLWHEEVKHKISDFI